ncbi:MAG: hypothetical protein KME11_03130 [Timaviella obliquedivisa GSE-PSE-MK23-08B]|jgi:hypothetical protein|nr:hypothetical protein [Timaviella obliquedivisa GSE-PSE-MK23-08B]MBW4514201.1 hypothetical protein [Timaviella obliquedivisa GSE-PSE-MK23-08B]
MPRPNFLSTDIKDQILQELEQTPDDFYFGELLHFILFLKERYDIEMESDEDAEDLADAQAALREIEIQGTVPWEQVKAELGVK